MPDLTGFLEPLAGATVSGEELRNDPRFHAIERAAEPANRANRIEAHKSGGTVQIDWATIFSDAQALAGSGRDLRLLVIAVRAMIATDGFDGLAQGLDLLSETVTRFWDTVHPLLRDGQTPREAATRRVNALYQLENPDTGVLGDLEFHPFMNLRLVGRVTGGDLAAGRLPRATIVSEAPRGLGEKELSALVGAHETRVARVSAACKQLATEQPDQFEALVAGLARARAALVTLENALAAQLGEPGAVRFAALATFLGRIADTLGAVQADPAAPQPEAHAMNGTPSPAIMPAAAAPAGGGVPGAINSRTDVERCLDMIIDFYERTEPSSPIPHLARRVRKMVPMNFLQLMEEIAPSGMKEFRSVAGVFEERPK